MNKADYDSARRYLDFEGTPNFRDYGGYQTQDGRTIKWRQLFRSGQLSTLSDRDLDSFTALGIRLVFDFRRSEESRADPSMFPEDSRPIVVELPINPGSTVNFFEALAGGQVSAEEMAEFMRSINREFVLERADVYREMFQHLLDHDQGASLVHCAAGKDRTGFAVAMMLASLGVSRETILADYMLTARYFNIDNEIQRISQKYHWPGDANAIRPMLEAREDYLQSAFAAIDERYSSIEDYLSDVLGLGVAERDHLRNQYLL